MTTLTRLALHCTQPVRLFFEPSRGISTECAFILRDGTPEK